MHIYKQIILILVIITISIELTNARTRNSGGSKPSKPSKPPGSTMKKLKKAAVIGVGVYAGYKLSKAAAKFANFDDPDIDFGAKYLVFSPLDSLKTRGKYIGFALLIWLSLYIF